MAQNQPRYEVGSRYQPTDDTLANRCKNFSRKRSMTMSPEAELQANAGEGHTPKRFRQVELETPSRSQYVPTPSPQQTTQSPHHTLTRRIASRPGRMARFIEGSMRDLRSQKPPSIFLRSEAKIQDTNPAFEDAINAYLEECEAAPILARPYTSKSTRRPSTSQSVFPHVPAFGLYHHANTSIAERPVIATTTATAPNTATEDHKESSGIFRFGKSIAAAFRPKSWQKPKTNVHDERDTSLDLSHGQSKSIDAESSKRDTLADAKEAFEELKRSGVIKDFTKTFVRPRTAVPSDDPNVRDSGIAFPAATQEPFYGQTNTTKDSLHNEYGNTYNTVDGRKVERRLSWTFRRPSLDEIRRIPSLTNVVHKRSATVDSPGAVHQQFQPREQQQQQPEGTRLSYDDKAEKKQSKLRKRVSKLEAQLESARLELEAQALAKAQEEALRQSLEQDREEEHRVLHIPANPKKMIRIPKRMKSGFVPGALPSVPSERLLLKSSDGDDKSTWSFKCAGESEVKPTYSGPDTVLEDEEADFLAAQQLRNESMSAPPCSEVPFHSTKNEMSQGGERVLSRRRTSRDLRKPQVVPKGLTSRFHPHIAALECDKENHRPVRSASQDLSVTRDFSKTGISSHRRISRTKTSDDLRNESVRPPSRGLPPPPPPPKDDAYPRKSARGQAFNFFEDGGSDDNNNDDDDGDQDDARYGANSLAIGAPSSSVRGRGPQVCYVKGLKQRSPEVAAKMRSTSQRAEFEWPEDCF